MRNATIKLLSTLASLLPLLSLCCRFGVLRCVLFLLDASILRRISGLLSVPEKYRLSRGI